MLTRTTHGLLVPQGSHEEAVRDALRRHDPELRLVPVESDAYGRRVYKVYRYQGPDRDAQFVLFWADREGNPLPLSMAIVDAVQLLDRSTVGRAPDEDERNRAMLEERRKDAERDFQAIEEEFHDRLSGKRSSPLPRSQSLYRARSRVREQTKTNELKP